MRALLTTWRWKLRIALGVCASVLSFAAGEPAGAQTRFHEPTPPAAYIPAQPSPRQEAAIAAAKEQQAAGPSNLVTQPFDAGAQTTAAAANPQVQEVLSAALKAAGLSAVPTTPP
jgi:hypothetical protein